jgi:hypothetical protein
MPEMRALATRIPCIELEVTNAEVAALMRRVALDGLRSGDDRLELEERVEVADFVIRESAPLGRPLDMRLYDHGLAARLQFEDHDSGCDWQDMVLSMIRGRPSVRGDIEPAGIRDQKKAQDLEFARQIVDLDPPERLRRWREKTGKSQATMYRYLKKLGKSDAADFEV